MGGRFTPDRDFVERLLLSDDDLDGRLDVAVEVQVSKVTVAVKFSDLSASFSCVGTRHEYPQVPPQPNGILPFASFLCRWSR